MTTTAGVFLASCLLMVAAGVTKVRSPLVAQRALGALVGPRVVPRRWVQAAGAAEVTLAGAALGGHGPAPAAAVSLCYFGFAAFVAATMARGGAGCGCFGAPAGAGTGNEVGDEVGDAPLGRLHVVVNLGLAGSALAVAASGGLHAGAAERIALATVAAGLAWTLYLVLVPLPRLLAAVREPGR